MDLLQQRFSTTELLKVTRRAGLHLEHERLKQWHKQGVLRGESVGRGNERSYTLGQLLHIAFMVFFADRCPVWMAEGREREGRLFQASMLASQVVPEILRAYENPGEMELPLLVAVEDEGETELEPIDRKMKVGIIGSIYGFRGALLVDLNQMAGELAQWMTEVIRGR